MRWRAANETGQTKGVHHQPRGDNRKDGREAYSSKDAFAYAMQLQDTGVELAKSLGWPKFPKGAFKFRTPRRSRRMADEASYPDDRELVCRPPKEATS
jgi:hypothetical protein